MQEIYPQIYWESFKAHNQGALPVNIYVIRGVHRHLIVDAGYDLPEIRTYFEQVFFKEGLDPRQTDLFITHNHVDHVGTAAWLAAQGVRVYMNAQDVEAVNPALCCLDESAEERENFVAMGLSSAQMAQLKEVCRQPDAKWIIPPIFCSTPIAPGDRLDVGQYHFEVVPLHGHTVAQQGLYDSAHGILFCGDQLVAKTTPFVVNWRKDQALLQEFLLSLQQIRQWHPTVILPGHGDFIDKEAAVIDFIAENYHNNLSDICQMMSLSKQWLTVLEVTMGIYEQDFTKFITGGVQRFFMVLSKTFACLEYMADRGLLSRTEQEGTLFYSSP